MRGRSKARELQLGSNGNDDDLTHLARARRPKVRHWWGRRSWSEPADQQDSEAAGIEGGGPAKVRRLSGAWCYVCDSPIVTWSSRWPITEQARAAIAAHRSAHIQGQLDLPPHPGDER